MNTQEKMEVLESKTAVKHGYGTAKYRWVSGLTPHERNGKRKIPQKLQKKKGKR